VNRSPATASVHAITAFWPRTSQVRLPAGLTSLGGRSVNSRYWAGRTGVAGSTSRAAGTLASWDRGSSLAYIVMSMPLVAVTA
jgi:hypothetical protein